MKYLLSHFAERDLLDLSQSLIFLTQCLRESETQFIYRANGLKQNGTCQSTAAETSFDQHLAQKLFLKADEIAYFLK